LSNTRAELPVGSFLFRRLALISLLGNFSRIMREYHAIHGFLTRD